MLAHASRCESGLHARESSAVAMVNSSPEYSITKPGLHHLRKRDKPLRTYGRQPSTPEAQSEPPPKRQRLSALEQQRKQQEEEPGSILQSQADTLKPDDPPIAPSSETKATQDTPTEAKPDIGRAASSSKGSTILSYFKPAPAPAPSKPRDETPPQPREPQPEPEEEPLAPPESPPKRKHSLRRKPRLLKIKAAVTHEPPDEAPPESDEDTPQAQRDSRQPLKNTTPNTLTDAEPEATSSSTTTTSPPSLSPRKKSLRNHQKPPPKRKTSKPSSPPVQTTLNISARAAFSECKICDTVWNPLYPDDVKFHDKRHRALLRAQKKRKMDEL
ncbi:hypothetical protein J3F83DRAFT_729689 [Trichoderma novae-zelandiae]